MRSKFVPLAMRSPTMACFKRSGWGAAMPIIGDVLNYISNKNTNRTNEFIAHQTNKANERIANNANDLNYQMFQEANQFSHDEALAAFNRENEYNTPAAQAARLVEAGFNPAAALDSGSLASATANSASPSSVSPLSAAVPNLIAPTMQSPHFQFEVADSLSKLAQAKKTMKEAGRVDDLADAQIDSLAANINLTEAKTAYQLFQNELDQMFGRAERKRGLDEQLNRIKKLGAEFTVAVQDGKVKEAQKYYYDAQKILADTQIDSLKEQQPLIMQNLRLVGQKTLAEAHAAKAAANASNASAKLSNEQAETVKARRDEIVRLDKELADEKTLSNEFTRDSFSNRLTEITKRLNLTESQTKYFEQQIARAKKENNIYYIREAVSILRQISDGVSQYIPTTGFNGTGSSLQMPSSSSSTAPEWSFLYGN